MKKLALSDNTGIQLPARNLITIIGACLIGAWFGFGVIERINVLETQNQLNSKDIEMNTEFRIKWPLGELGSLPADSEQFLLIEDLVKDVEKIQEQMELEFEKLAQRDRESQRRAQTERERLESQEQQTDIRVAAELQQAEMRDDRDIDSNLTEIARIVRESREQE